MIDQVKSHILRENLIPNKNTRVYLAVSGGIDSCVMLDILAKLKNDFQIKPAVIHFNHQTRGEENYKDEEFVTELAKKYKFSVQIGRLRKKTRSSETLLREERYKFFNSVLKEEPKALIATAHNLDDDVETFLMRMVRGSRMRGLLGIPVKRGNFIRPLLNQSRKSIEKYARKNNIKFRQDHTNQQSINSRNMIRNEIIPYLEEKLTVDLRTNINKTLQDLKAHYQIYEQQLQAAVNESVKPGKTGHILNRKKFAGYPDPIRRGLVEYCISKVHPLNYSVSDKNFYLWDDFILNSQPGKKFIFYDDKIAFAERSNILFDDLPQTKNEFYILKPGYKVKIEDRYVIEMSRVNRSDVKFSEDRQIEFIDGDKSGPELIIRFWQYGDVFSPLGMRSRRKLSDFFTDIKLSARLKKQTPIIVSPGTDKIVWLAGHRLDESFKISEKTKIIYKLKLKSE